ncbi:MAG: amidohydrolase family protein [Burkholderiaceae bacterium]|nr:amidohydrolase family protein [Burkholderiaceae bacterium]
MADSEVLFTNVRIIDGTGAAPYPGEVLVRGRRISRVARNARSFASGGGTVIDGAGATLMPGMVEAHTHFAWNNASGLSDIQKMPVEEHTLWTARVAKLYLDQGWTSCVGAATAKPRLDVVVRNAINSGLIPGPRYLAASQEITVPGGLGDETLPHLPFPEFSFAVNVSGPDDMRRACRMFLQYGVDSIKLNLSGDNLVPHANAKTTWMTDAEVKVAVEEATMRGKRVAVHARSADSVKQAVRLGCEVIYHASYTDNEALDLLEANKHKVFVAPGLSVIFKLLQEGTPYGITPAKAREMGYEDELAAATESMRAMHKRGIRVLPGGDYGFAWAPHGTNATDLQYFVRHCGMTPMDALVSATRYGGQIMLMGNELGEVKEGYLADLLLVDGDPLADLSILLDKSRLLAIMKDGVFHKAPDMANNFAGSRRSLRPPYVPTASSTAMN